MSLKQFVRKQEPLLFLDDTDTVGVTIDRMIDGHFGAALVIGSEKKLVGIFTERDVLTKIVRPGLDPSSTLVKEVMTVDVVTIEEAQTLDAAIHCIQAYQVSRG